MIWSQTVPNGRRTAGSTSSFHAALSARLLLRGRFTAVERLLVKRIFQLVNLCCAPVAFQSLTVPILRKSPFG